MSAVPVCGAETLVFHGPDRSNMRGSVAVRWVVGLLPVVAVCSGTAYLFWFDDVEHSRASVSLQLQRPDLDIPGPSLRFLVTANSLSPAARISDDRRLGQTSSPVPVVVGHPVCLVDASEIRTKSVGQPHQHQ